MDLDNARNLKAEIFKSVFEYNEHPHPAETTVLVADGLPRFLNPKVLNAAETGGTYIGPELDIGIGFTWMNGSSRKNTSDMQIAILLRDKRRRDLPIIDRIIRAAKGEVVVINTGRIRAQAFPLDRERPLKVGCSIGHKSGRVGSLGCFVSTASQPIGALSANHVLARMNAAAIGDQILQPARPDGGIDPADRMGNLAAFHPLGLGSADINYVDCAIANVNAIPGGRPPYDLSLRTGSPVGRLNGRIQEPDVGMDVWKIGRTTVLTSGFVQLIEVDQVYVDMGSGKSRRTLRFDQQIAISGKKDGGAFSKDGDSGALVYQKEGSAVGLVIAGSDTGALNDRALTFASPIGAVLAALRAELLV